MQGCQGGFFLNNMALLIRKPESSQLLVGTREERKACILSGRALGSGLVPCSFILLTFKNQTWLIIGALKMP